MKKEEKLSRLLSFYIRNKDYIKSIKVVELLKGNKDLIKFSFLESFFHNINNETYLEDVINIISSEEIDFEYLNLLIKKFCNIQNNNSYHEAIMLALNQNIESIRINQVKDDSTMFKYIINTLDKNRDCKLLIDKIKFNNNIETLNQWFNIIKLKKVRNSDEVSYKRRNFYVCCSLFKFCKENQKHLTTNKHEIKFLRINSPSVLSIEQKYIELSEQSYFNCFTQKTKKYRIDLLILPINVNKLIFSKLTLKDALKVRLLCKSYKQLIDYSEIIKFEKGNYQSDINLIASNFQIHLLNMYNCKIKFRISTEESIPEFELNLNMYEENKNNTKISKTKQFPLYITLDFDILKICYFNKEIQVIRKFNKQDRYEEFTRFVDSNNVTCVHCEDKLLTNEKKEKFLTENSSEMALNSLHENLLLISFTRKTEENIDQATLSEPTVVFDLKNNFIAKTYFFDLYFKENLKHVFQKYLWRCIFT